MSTIHFPTAPSTKKPRVYCTKWQRVQRWGLLGLLLAGLGLCGLVMREQTRWQAVDRFTSDGGQGRSIVTRRRNFLNEISGGYLPASMINGLVEYDAIVGINATEIRPDEYAQLAWFTEVEAASFHATELTPELIQCLRQFKRLRYLSITNSRATDATLAELCKALKDHPHLVGLSLGRTEVTGAGFQELKHLRHLTNVDIAGPRENYKKGESWLWRSPLR